MSDDRPTDPTGGPTSDPAGGPGDDTGETGPVGFRVESVDTGTDTGTDTDTRSRRPGPRVIAAIFVVAAAAVIATGAFLATRGGDPPPPPTTTTTSTTTTQTTISPAVVVATARQPSIQVSATPPADWETAATAVRYGPPPPPSSAAELQATGQALPPLPREDYPIEGRQVTPAGWIFANPTSLGDPFVMLVTEQRGDHLQVQVPVRPNGTVGYVRTDEVDLTTSAQRLELDVSDRRLRFLDGDVVVAETSVVVGTDDTPTPTGRFYVTDQIVKDNPEGAYGPRILATSAYSEQLDEFDDGAPVVAFHGTNRPELIGSAASNGCIRMPNDVVTLIGDRLKLGARVDITP